MYIFRHSTFSTTWIRKMLLISHLSLSLSLLLFVYVTVSTYTLSFVSSFTHC